MSIATELQRIQQAKADIKAALEGKGITVQSTLKIDGYAELIESIVPDTRVTAKFNVTDTSNPTLIVFVTSGFSAIEIDGVAQPSVVSAYTFSTTGEHTVKYVLINTTSIGNETFAGCGSLTSIDIPSGVTSIGNYTFNGCGSLTSVTMPNSVTSIGNGAFGHCEELRFCTIGSGVTSIGNGAFGHCMSLESVTIGSGVTSIGEDAFRHCMSLESVTIGSGVTSIGQYAFDGCFDLTSVTIEATTPPTLGSNTFDEYANYPIYVPCSSVDTYKAASGWSNYSSRIQALT